MDAHVPLDSLQPYIDDALDLIEFANGDTLTTWGSVRASMGHPAPFGLKFIGVGNEQWGPEFVERLEPFVKAIRARYPDVKIVGSSGPSASGDKFDYLWPEMTRLGADLVDEHYYAPETFFLSGATRYDNYSRKGPHVFAGEYACHGTGKKYNHFNAALLEAAFMTGLERNADIVDMATYAPLFAHIEGWQWRPDMIWFDNLRSVPTASYYVQQLYATHRGERVLPLTLDGKPLTGADSQHGLYATATSDGDTYIIKVVNTSDEPRDITIDFRGLPRKKQLAPEYTLITLSSPEGPDVDNVASLLSPGAIDSLPVAPVTTKQPVDTPSSLTATIPAQTFAILLRSAL